MSAAQVPVSPILRGLTSSMRPSQAHLEVDRRAVASYFGRFAAPLAMTHCLDCGSERTTDQCPSCGLTSAAAEVMFRRRLVFRTAIFLLGSLAFPYISQIYPPLDIDLMLIFFGLIFFGVLFLAVVLERRARNRQEIEILKRIYAGFIPLPWILAATLFINGRLDAQKRHCSRQPPLACAVLAPRPAF
jgi:hypothetical protein